MAEFIKGLLSDSQLAEILPCLPSLDPYNPQKYVPGDRCFYDTPEFPAISSDSPDLRDALVRIIRHQFIVVAYMEFGSQGLKEVWRWRYEGSYP